MEFKPVVFKVDNQNYGVDISLVNGIEKVQQIVMVPNSNPDIKGIINLRGDVVPIYSLRHHFKLPEVSPTDDTKFIVVQTRGLNIALEVDSVQEIQNLEEGQMHDMPLIVKSDETSYFRKVVNVGGSLILIINIEELLSEEEANHIQKLVDDLKEE